MLDSTLGPEYTRENYILRDYLAADRTILSNERTFLSYLRTALTSFVVGASFIKFFDGHLVFFTLGWLFIPLGMCCAIFGVIRYRQMKRLILKAEKTKAVLENIA